MSARLLLASLFLLLVPWGGGVSSAALDPAGLDAQEKTGAIAGKLDSIFARKYPAAIYIEAIKDKEFKPPKKNPVMDQVDLVFTPRVLPVLVGSTVDFPNSDDVRHNVYTTKSSCCQFNLGTYPAGETKQVKCEKVGVTTLLCNVHAEMVGYIVICPTPYFATTDKKGDFRIEGVPAGNYKITFWHEKLEPQVLDVKVEAAKDAEVVFKKVKRKR